MNLNNSSGERLGQLFLGFILIFALLSNSLQLVSASASDASESFKYLSEIDFPADREEDYFILDIDPLVLDTIEPSLKDFRIYLGQQELSYAKLPFPNKNLISSIEMEIPILNTGTSDKDIYSFVLHMPKYNPDQYVTVELNQPLYLVKGHLFGSNNNRDWIKLKPITLYQTGQEINRISLENIDFEYLRIEFQQPLNESLEVKEANLYTYELQEIIQQVTNKSYPFEITNNKEQKITQILIDLKYNHQPIFEWSFDTEDKGFYRRVLVEGSSDQETWNGIGSTYIFRDIEGVDTKLDYEFEPKHYRYLRLTIENEDNQPLDIQSIKIKTYPVNLLVKLPKNIDPNSKKIFAYWGNEILSSPDYDLENFVQSINQSKYPIVSLTTYSKNDQYREQEINVPLTEKYPFILPGGLMLAVVFIGFILYRNVKQMKED